MNPYRQGDVLLVPVEKLEKKNKVESVNGRTILAYGEVTGHHHSFSDKNATLYSCKDYDEVEVKGERVKEVLAILENKKTQVTVDCPRIGLIDFAKADVKIKGRMAHIDGLFAPLTHQEHGKIAVKQGNYIRRPQFEYRPEDVRKVVD